MSKNRLITAYVDEKGSLHQNLSSAIESDIRELLDEVADQGLISTRVLAAQLVEPTLRQKLMKLLKESA